GADQGDVLPLLEQVRHAPDVVLVAVGEDDALDVVEAVADRGEVRQDHVDAGWCSSGKSTPQSTIMSLPRCSKTVMLRPTSPRPPSAVMRMPFLARRGGAVSLVRGEGIGVSSIVEGSWSKIAW